MSAEIYRRAKEILPDVVALDAGSRDAFLDSVCAGDAALRLEVESLLRFTGPRGDTLDAAALIYDGSLLAEALAADGGSDSAASPPRFDAGSQRPTRVGPYEIVGVLGEGGMGVVYEARQDHPRRSIALKLLRPGFVTAQTLRRFEHEAELLGQLQHPGIAHIYDAGTAPVEGPAGVNAGQPFFAMELVRGEPLAANAERRKLDLRARLELVASVCDAVEHAHQKGVIHRDLKPANILVDETGRPRVLDFGVARLANTEAETITLQTGLGQIVGTLAYMSPEQVGGDSRQVDTRTDVYSLGVILYELLVGRKPIELQDAPLPEALRRIREDDPPRPATIQRVLRGDIETIVLTAMARDRERRYQSAAALAQDIRRYLNREPIAARPASAMYQFRRFAQRNKALVIGAATTALALLLGLAGTAYGLWQMTEQRDEAAHQRDEAARQRDEAARQRDEAARMTEEAQLQAKIVQAANDFLTDDLLELADPDNEANRDITLREVLDRAAKKIDGRFPDAPSLEANIRMAIGKSYSHLGLLDQAEAQLSRAQERYEAAGDEHASQALLARMELAALLMERAQFPQAERLFLELLEIQRERFGPRHEQTMASLHNLGTIYVQQSRHREAEPILREVLALRLEVLGEDTPTAVTMNVLGTLCIYTERLDEAIELLDRSLNIHRRVSGERHPDTLQVLGNLGVAYSYAKRYDESEAVLLEAIDLHRRVFGPDHRATLAVLGQLASVYSLQKKPECEPLLREVLEAKRRLLGEDHLETLIARLNLARPAYDRREYDAVQPEFRALSRAMSIDHADNWLTGFAFLLNGRCLAYTDRLAEAEPEFLRAYDILNRALGEKNVRTQQPVEALIDLYERCGDVEQAAFWKSRKQPPPGSP